MHNSAEKDPTKMLSPQEAADRLSISRWTIYDMIRDGRLKSYKISRLVRILESEISRVLVPREKGLHSEET